MFYTDYLYANHMTTEISEYPCIVFNIDIWSSYNLHYCYWLTTTVIRCKIQHFNSIKQGKLSFQVIISILMYLSGIFNFLFVISKQHSIWRIIFLSFTLLWIVR